MLKNSTIRNGTLILLLVALLIGLIHLFMLRFQAGDIYPAYSSLRSDPLGTRIFYDSLGKFDDIDLQRNYRLLHSLKSRADTAFFYLGAQIPVSDWMPKKTSRDLDRLTQSGGRLIISYLPVNKKTDPKSCPDNTNDGDDGPQGPTECDSRDQNQAPQPDPVTISQPAPDDSKDRPEKQDGPGKSMVSIKEHWGFGFAYKNHQPLKGKDKKHLVFEARSSRPDLPAVISWHTNLYFELFDDSWQTLYTVDDNPVIIERPMGRGTIVLCADSYFVSNEALRSERHPQLLVWLLGGHSNIMFDESHFGIHKSPGIAGLLRHYRFHWFIGALVLVALLFVWQNAIYFVPPLEDDTSNGAGIVSEKDYAQGLIALLRSNIKSQKILPVCGREWERTFKKDRRIQSGAIEHMNRILQSESDSSKKKSDPVAGYRNISRLFKRIGIYSRNA
ncbi:MAG: hypothetical protein GY850_16550 [bacterium]|nr:hypothetical protein [bacterium]